MPRFETTETHDPSLTQLLRDLRDDTVALLRQEVALAKREMAWKFTSLGRNAVFLGFGGLLGLYCLFFLFAALSNLIQLGLFAVGLSIPMASWLAPLALGMLLGIAALALALKALRGIRKTKPIPEQTLATLKEDKEWLKGTVK